jgi:hypothetical protein
MICALVSLFLFAFDVFSDDDFGVGDEGLNKRLHTERPEGAHTSARNIVPRRSKNLPVIKKSTGSKKRPLNPEEPEHILEGNLGTMHAEQWREFVSVILTVSRRGPLLVLTRCSGLKVRSRCGMITTMTRHTSRGAGLCISMHST